MQSPFDRSEPIPCMLGSPDSFSHKKARAYRPAKKEDEDEVEEGMEEKGKTTTTTTTTTATVARKKEASLRKIEGLQKDKNKIKFHIYHRWGKLLGSLSLSLSFSLESLRERAEPLRPLPRIKRIHLRRSIGRN